MDIKQVLLPEAIDTDELLYYRKDEELVETGKDGSLVFHKGGAADFNTFFNSFSIGYSRAGSKKNTPDIITSTGTQKRTMLS